jgi:hypothetical protein
MAHFDPARMAEDVARAAVFLASENAGFVTGQSCTFLSGVRCGGQPGSAPSPLPEKRTYGTRGDQIWRGAISCLAHVNAEGSLPCCGSLHTVGSHPSRGGVVVRWAARGAGWLHA